MKFRFLSSFILLSNFSLYAKTNLIRGSVELLDNSGAALSEYSQLVVYIEKVKTEFQPSGESKVIKLINRTFNPTVTVVQKGTEVEFPNMDLVFHNVFSLSPTKTFDLGVYNKDSKAKSVLFDKEGLVKIFCKFHESMYAFVLVLDNPFFTDVNNEGQFTLPIHSLSSGSYTVVLWKPFENPVKQTINLTSNSQSTLGLSFKLSESHSGWKQSKNFDSTK